MWRSDGESMILNTYVPAGKTCAPTPGTSNGALNVMTVLRFQSSAEAVGNTKKHAATRHTITKILVNAFICILSLNSVNGRAKCEAGCRRGPGAPGRVGCRPVGSASAACGDLLYQYRPLWNGLLVTIDRSERFLDFLAIYQEK